MWYQFDCDDGDESNAELDEHAALVAIKAIADLGDADPDKGLIVGATQWMISPIAGSRAQSLNLRSVMVKRGGQ